MPRMMACRMRHEDSFVARAAVASVAVAGKFSARYTCVVTAGGRGAAPRGRGDDDMAISEPVTVEWMGEGLLFRAATAHGRVDLGVQPRRAGR